MPPQAAKAKAKGKSKEPVDARPLQAPVVIDGSPNATIWSEVQQILVAMRENPILNGIDANDPLPIGGGSNQVPFKKADFKIAIGQLNEYKAVCNFMWQGFAEREDAHHDQFAV